MAKARIGHFAEAQVLQEIGVDMIDESEGNVLLYVSVFCLASVFFLNNLASESLLVSSYITGWWGGGGEVPWSSGDFPWCPGRVVK